MLSWLKPNSMLPQALTRRLCRACLSRVQRTRAPLPPRQLSCLIYTSRRHMSTPPLVQPSEIPVQTYHKLSEVTMDTLLESLETLLDSLSNAQYEVEYSSGVLTLNLADKGTYVINKQPPNKQIWLSSPFSGPKRYDYLPSQDGWYYSRDGKSLGTLLEIELSNALGQKVELRLEDISKKIV